jgi:hypothetical protein
LFAIHVAKLANQITFPNKWAEIFMQAYLLQSRFSLRLAARQYGEVVFRQLADGALFAVFALRSLGEVGPGTNFIECWRDSGTNLIGAANLSPVTKLGAGTGAVSRYNL